MADPNKTKQVVDLTEYWKKFNLVYERTVALSKEWSANVSKSMASVNSSGSGGGSFQNPGTNPGGVGGFHQPPKPSGYTLGQAAGDAFATGAAALTQLISPSAYIENEMARRRFGAFGGSSTATGAGYRNGAFQQMMRGGTFMDPMEGARAAMAGISQGFVPGLNNYSTVSKSVATMSNLMPGVTGEQAMNAVSAVNQASSVNRLRMIGIQVRNANGDFMGITSIVNQLWNLLLRQATPGKPITKSDIAFSLQPGNALASLLDQYFGNDPILRSGVITALMAKASGSDLSKKSLEDLGINPGVASSTGKKNAATYSTLNKYTKSGAEGVMDANATIAAAAQAFDNGANDFTKGVNHFVTTMDVLSGAGGGAGGTFMVGLSSMIGNALGPSVAKIGGTLSRTLATSLGLELEGAAATSIGAAIGAAIVGELALVLSLGGDAQHGKPQIDPTTGKRRDYSQPGMRQTHNAPSIHGTSVTPTSTSPLTPGSLLPSSDGTGGEGVGGVSGASISSPLDGTLSTPKNGEFGNFASFRTRKHRGQDFKAKTGTPIKAVRAGKVVKVGTEGDLGNMIRIRHADGMHTVYAHLSSQGVTEGTEVSAGQQIGLAGWSGGVYPKGPEGAHLHLALEDSHGGVHDPMPYISGASSVYSNLGNNMSTIGAAKSPASSSMYNMGSTSMYSTATGDVGGYPTSSGAVNYGGVTVHINVPQGIAMNETTLAHEIKRILRDEDQMKMAVSR